MTAPTYTKPGTLRYEWGTEVHAPPSGSAPAPGTDAYATGWTGEMSDHPHGELRDGTGWRVRITGTRPGGHYALVLTATTRGPDLPSCKLRAALADSAVSCELRQDKGGLIGMVRGVMLRATAAGTGWRIEGEGADG